MRSFFRKLVSIFIGIADDNNNDISKGKYKPDRRPKRCEICEQYPDYLYKFNHAWLCKPCFDKESKRYSGIIPTEERPNNIKLKGKDK